MIGQQSNDGWLLALLHFGCSEFGWSIDYVKDDVSVLMLLLMVRQKLTIEGKIGLTLADKELLDNSDWDALLRKNRQQLKANIK